MIELQQVSFAYQQVEALKDITVTIKKGDSIVLIGPNGSGKSTFLKLINGIILPSKGQYLFEGEAITQKKLEHASFSKAFHQKIGFVFQNSETQLFCASVYEEIAFGPRQMGLSESEVEKRVEDCLNLLDLQHLKHRAPYHLSGGEKKKVAIASVLSLNPKVLVLDEPMNALDPKTKRFLRELLMKLKKAGKTLLCSTHDFEYIEGIFEKALVFSKDHKLIREDSYEAVLEDEAFLVEQNIK